MANATLVTQKVQEIHLSNKLEKSGQIQLDSSFSLNVSFPPTAAAAWESFSKPSGIRNLWEASLP